MDENFQKEYFEIKNEALFAANDWYFSHADELADSFREALVKSCARVAQMQEKGFPAMEYMEITMLRTRLLKGDYRLPVMVYGKDWYADPKQAQAGEADGSGLFLFYESLIQQAEGIIKKYRSKLPERMREICMCTAAELFWNYAYMAGRRAVMGFEPAGAAITDAFRVRVCEYMGYGAVCRRYMPRMKPEELKEWFGRGPGEDYKYRDYRGYDCSGWDFSGLDLDGCDFSGCVLDGCCFENASLSGAWLCNSSIKNASFRNAWLTGARFDGSDLEGSVFITAYSICRVNEDVWRKPDYHWASFAGCKLKNADFTFTKIAEADFSGADLEGCQFNNAHRTYYEVDDEQREKAVWNTF